MSPPGEAVSNREDGTTETDEAEQEYSRRGFMEAAGAAGAAGAVAGLAGCLGDGSAGNGEPDFRWWTMRGYVTEEEEAIKEAGNGYEDHADDPVNVTTEVNTWDVVFTEWNSAIQGQNTPNVSEMANEHAVNFGTDGVVRENTDLYEEYDDWYDTPEIWGLYEGDKWGFPWFIEIRQMMANTEILEEAGHDSVPETWEEVIEAGMDVDSETDATGFATPGAQDNMTGQCLYGMATQLGANWFDYDEDAEEWRVTMDDADALFAHLWYASMQEEWGIAPEGWAGQEGPDVENLWAEGELAMTIGTADPLRTMIEDDQEVMDVAEVTLTPEGPNGERTSFMGGSCLSGFTDEYAEHTSGNEHSMDFIDYMTQPDTMNDYFPEATPTFLPVREAQEEIEPYTENNTEIPDEWIQTRLDQASDAKRYGITGAERAAPFLGSLEGDTNAYSTAISGILGDSGSDPKERIREQANTVRETISEETDYELEPKEDGPSLDDAGDLAQPWIEGDGVPQIWNPYE